MRPPVAYLSYEEYHPYGSTSWHAGDWTEVSQKRYRYTGKEKDDETGLYYHGARFYAPWLGRWTSADPIGMGDGVNRFAYVHGNPIRGRDPTGMWELPSAERLLAEYGITPQIHEALSRWTPTTPATRAVKVAALTATDFATGVEYGIASVARPEAFIGDVVRASEPGRVVEAMYTTAAQGGSVVDVLAAGGKVSREAATERAMEPISLVIEAASLRANVEELGVQVATGEPSTKAVVSAEIKEWVTGEPTEPPTLEEARGATIASASASATVAGVVVPFLFEVGAVAAIARGEAGLLGAGRGAAAAWGGAPRGIGDALGSVEDVLANPRLLSGLSPADLQSRLVGRIPASWRVEALGRGAHKGQGFVLRQYTPLGDPTGRQIRWHPGGGHHGPSPYWRVIDANTKSDIIPGAPWP